MERIDDDVASFLHQFLVNLVVSVIVLYSFGLETFLGEGKDCGSRLQVVVLRVIVIWSRFHLWKFERLRGRFAIDYSTCCIHFGINVLLVSSSEVMHAFHQVQKGASLGCSCELTQIKIVIFDDCASVIFEESVQLQGNAFPVNKFQFFSKFFLFFLRDEVFRFCGLFLHDCAHRRSSFSLILIDKQRHSLIFTLFRLKPSIFPNNSLFHLANFLRVV